MRGLASGLIGLLVVACGSIPIRPEAGTMPPLPLPTKLAVIGDFGSGSDNQYRVARTMQERVTGSDIDVFVTTGDNFYNDRVEEIWSEPYGWVDKAGIRIAATWGNHDLESETRRKLVRDVLGPPGAYYAMSLGPGKLIVLDSNNVADGEQYRWLVDQLADSESPLIVAFHHPPYSCGVYGNENAANERWLPVFEEFGVDLVLNGHEHHYERFVVNDTMYVVTGGGGRSLRQGGTCPADTPEPVAANYTDHHFLIVSIGDSRITAEVVAADGSTIDLFDVDY